MNRSPKLTAEKRVRPTGNRSLRLHGTIARELGMAIVSGRYEPGDLLEGEIVSSEQLAVSRTAYREAVRILAAKGLIDPRPKIGTRINPRQRWNFLDPDVLEWIFHSDPDADVLNALFELRDLIEPAAAALAARRRTPAQLAALKVALNDMRLYTLRSVVGQNADRNFHAVLLQATQNAFLISLANSVAAAIHITTVFKQRNGPLRRNALPDHERVYEAIAAKHPARAHSAMRELIRLAGIDTTRATQHRIKAERLRP